MICSTAHLIPIRIGIWYKVGKAEVRYLAQHEPTLKILRQIVNDLSMDVLYLNGVFTTMTISTLLFRQFGLVRKIPVIVASRGMLSVGALAQKSLKKRLFLSIAKFAGLYEQVTWHATKEQEKDEIVHALSLTRNDNIVCLSKPT